eukprot:5524022-Prymnesium_polylepis.1
MPYFFVTHDTVIECSMLVALMQTMERTQVPQPHGRHSWALTAAGRSAATNLFCLHPAGVLRGLLHSKRNAVP